MKKKKSSTISIEQWSTLYDIASKIKMQEPWKLLNDTDLITVMLPEYDEPVFISVMGASGECFGIGVYPGYKGISGLYRLLDMDEFYSPVDPLVYQNCLLCYYGDRKELDSSDREIIKSLNLKFRGQNNWIYFRAMKEGCIPWFLNDGADAEIIIQALQHFYTAYQDLASGKIKVNFREGNTLLRHYSLKQEEWSNDSAPIPEIPEQFLKIVLSDDLQARRLKNAKKTNVSLELDISYLPILIPHGKDDAPKLTRLLSLLDRNDAALLGDMMIDPNLKDEDAIVQVITDYILEYGKPNKIFVRDKYFIRQVKSLCSQIDIPLTYGEGMECTDEFLDDMADFLLESGEGFLNYFDGDFES